MGIGKCMALHKTVFYIREKKWARETQWFTVSTAETRFYAHAYNAENVWVIFIIQLNIFLVYRIKMTGSLTCVMMKRCRTYENKVGQQLRWVAASRLKLRFNGRWKSAEELADKVREGKPDVERT